MLIKDSIRDNCIQFLNFLPKVTFVLPNSLLKVCYQWNMNHMTCHHHIKQVRIHFNAKLEYLEKFVPGCLLSEFELKEIGILIWLRMDQEWTWNGAWEHQMENELIVSELNFMIWTNYLQHQAVEWILGSGHWSANTLKCCIQERLDKWNLLVQADQVSIEWCEILLLYNPSEHSIILYLTK